MISNKAPISNRALRQRIAVKLQSKDLRLVVALGAQDIASVGRYYVANTRRGTVERTHVDLEAFGREVGALRPWEELAVEGGAA